VLIGTSFADPIGSIVAELPQDGEYTIRVTSEGALSTNLASYRLVLFRWIASSD